MTNLVAWEREAFQSDVAKVAQFHCVQDDGLSADLLIGVSDVWCRPDGERCEQGDPLGVRRLRWWVFVCWEDDGERIPDDDVHGFVRNGLSPWFDSYADAYDFVAATRADWTGEPYTPVEPREATPVNLIEAYARELAVSDLTEDSRHRLQAAYLKRIIGELEAGSTEYTLSAVDADGGLMPIRWEDAGSYDRVQVDARTNSMYRVLDIEPAAMRLYK